MVHRTGVPGGSHIKPGFFPALNLSSRGTEGAFLTIDRRSLCNFGSKFFTGCRLQLCSLLTLNGVFEQTQVSNFGQADYVMFLSVVGVSVPC